MYTERQIQMMLRAILATAVKGGMKECEADEIFNEVNESFKKLTNRPLELDILINQMVNYTV